MRILVWVLPIIMIAASLIPADLQIRPGLNKQLEHFLFYALSAAAFGLVYPRHFWLIIITLITAASSLEVLQVFAIGRTPSLWDFIASANGAVFGVFLCFVCRKLLLPNPA